MAKRSGLKLYAFYMLGFPWEKREDLEQTLSLAIELNCDFNEFHIAVPYEGTPLYEICLEQGLISESSMQHDYFRNPMIGTAYLTKEEVLEFRNNAINRFHWRVSYILQVVKGIRSFKQLKNYILFGVKKFL